ncbi:hypothetical protein, partial [Dubosiella newyorkensis]|uniref:hypothetical protein n=1 Tax=Dubosiella newyorkensis TaxID=1862672 RepID=UPI002572556C
KKIFKGIRFEAKTGKHPNFETGVFFVHFLHIHQLAFHRSFRSMARFKKFEIKACFLVEDPIS